MSSITNEEIQNIIEQAEKKQHMQTNILVFALGVDIFYSDKPRGPLTPKYSAPYDKIGKDALNSILPLIQNIFCKNGSPKKNIRRTLALVELISVISPLFSKEIIISLVAVILSKGIDEICSID